MFISSDKDEAAFTDYYSSMPWLALDFADRDLKAKLSKKFGVSGIPSLVIIDHEGKLITTKGRDGVSENPSGFPWLPEFSSNATVIDVLSVFTTLSKEGGDVIPASLAGKHLLIYFSGHWCGPCRKFTPMLVTAYNALRARGVEVECVFVSSDNSAAEFEEYKAEMPWAAAPYGHAKFAAIKSWFDEKYEIEGIPTLLLFAPDGSLLDSDCSAKLRSDPTASNFPWPPKPVESLEATMGKINEGPVIIAFCAEGVDIAAITATLEPAANAWFGKPDAPRFCVGKASEGQAESIGSFCNLTFPSSSGNDWTMFVIIDVPARKKCIATGETCASAEALATWVESYLAGSAEVVGIKD